MFHEPRIAGNTGNAIRMSAATGAALHLVAPLFDLSEAKVRRAGLDYHDLAHVVVHADLSDALDTLPDARVIAFTTQAPCGTPTWCTATGTSCYSVRSLPAWATPSWPTPGSPCRCGSRCWPDAGR